MYYHLHQILDLYSTIGETLEVYEVQNNIVQEDLFITSI